ncbi:MAG: efflux RND transporter periplasmic adaptor subunit [Lachnospiraceae bacterium]|nr:efflux RND transporter periplasmic adaptor subunit [Lachnospiraceae bacterium]MBQ6026230.1 efflux RND transporter periplasmic adaptor subunit [Lachnospiraceae bacterium]
MFKKILILVLLTMCVCVCSACSNGAEEVQEDIPLLEPANAKVETTYVSKMDISQVEIHDGAVIPSFDEFSFDVNGYLYGVFVEPGDKVYKGDVLAGLVGHDHQAILDLEDEIKELEENNVKLFESYDLELELTRLNGGDVSEKTIETRQKKELAEFELQQKKDRLARLKENDIGYVSIVAPYDSVVVAVSSAGNNSYISKGTAIVALDNGKDPMITCNYFISESAYQKEYSCYAMVRGQRLELEYIPYTKNELKVIVNNGISPATKFEIKDLKDEEIYVGDYASVIEVKNFKADVLAIPQNAVYADATGQFVYEIKDGERIRRPVILGISDNANVEVVEGLEEGACIYVKS